MLIKKSFVWLVLLIASARSTNLRLPEILKSFDTKVLLEKISHSGLLNDTECGRHLTYYADGLQSGESWAQLMFDSNAKIPDGILKGNLMVLGQYDECVGVEETPFGFSGQYCMIDLSVTLSRVNIKDFSKTIHSSLSQQPIGKGEAPEDNTVLLVLYGLCLPSTCGAFEIESAFNQVFHSSEEIGNLLSVKVDPQNCVTSEPPKLSSGDWVVVGFLAAMGVIVICSSIYDMFERFHKRNDQPHPLLSSFSIYTNGKFLFKISHGAHQMKALHGLRVLSMCWVVLGHVYESSLNGPLVNPVDLETKMQDVNHVLVANGYMSVDSFFFLSGLLACFVFLREMGKKGSYDILLGYIHRYIRLTPPFAVLILLQVTILLYIGNGPLWNRINESRYLFCKDYWWSGLLYVQNLVNPLETCIGQSWYLSVDMQMHWISPLILYPMFLWPMIAPFYITFAILGAAFITFAVAYINDLGPSILVTTSARQLEFDYDPFYTRMAPWLIGVALGYLMAGIQAKKIRVKLSKLQVTLGWMFSTGVCLACIYGIIPFNNGKYDYSTVAASFYLAFHRVGWALGLAWIVFACVQGYGGPVNTFLSWDVFQPLSKLTYCTFLIHMSIQFYRIGAVRTNQYMGDLEHVYYFLGDYVLSNLIAIPFTLIFEIPFINISRHLFRNVQILPLPKAKREVIKTENNDDTEVGKVNPGFAKS